MDKYEILNFDTGKIVASFSPCKKGRLPHGLIAEQWGESIWKHIIKKNGVTWPVYPTPASLVELERKLTMFDTSRYNLPEELFEI